MTEGKNMINADIVSICWSARVPCHVGAARPHQHAPIAARPKRPEAGCNYPADSALLTPRAVKAAKSVEHRAVKAAKSVERRQIRRARGYPLAHWGVIWHTAAHSKVPTTGMDIAMPAKRARSELVNSSTGKFLTSKPCKAKHCFPVRQTPARGT